MQQDTSVALYFYWWALGTRWAHTLPMILRSLLLDVTTHYINFRQIFNQWKEEPDAHIELVQNSCLLWTMELPGGLVKGRRWLSYLFIYIYIQNAKCTHNLFTYNSGRHVSVSCLRHVTDWVSDSLTSWHISSNISDISDTLRASSEWV